MVIIHTGGSEGEWGRVLSEGLEGGKRSDKCRDKTIISKPENKF